MVSGHVERTNVRGFRPHSLRNPLSFPHFLAVMAWNIDYEYDSEEVILLKKHIAEQGSSGRAVYIPRLTSHLCSR